MSAETPTHAPKPRKKTTRDRTIAQVRTIASRAGVTHQHMLVKLRAAGVAALDGGPLYAHSRVNLDEAMRALHVAAENVAAELPPEVRAITPPDTTGRLAADAAAAKEKLADIPQAPYTGDDDQTPPQFILEGALDASFMDFPPIPNPDPDKIYYPIHTNPDRQSRMLMKGYQFVKRADHIKRIGLGTLERFINSRGRVQWKDRELAFIPVAVATARAKARREAAANDRRAVDETFDANVEATKRSLGRGADTKLAAFQMPVEEAAERRDHAAAVRAGVTRVTVDYGSTSTPGKPVASAK